MSDDRFPLCLRDEISTTDGRVTVSIDVAYSGPKSEIDPRAFERLAALATERLSEKLATIKRSDDEPR